MVANALYIKGNLEEEINFTPRDLLGEECGVMGAINLDNASRYVHDMGVLLEHRGEASAGIISHDGRGFHERRKNGPMRAVFRDFDFNELPGRISIGHDRYATCGGSSERNIQPFLLQNAKFGLSHNGTVHNLPGLINTFGLNPNSFTSTTDSEPIAHAIIEDSGRRIREKIRNVLKKVPPSFSLVMMTNNKLIGAKDPYGIRPLHLAQIPQNSGPPGFLMASESFALDQFKGVEYLGSVKPGEMVIIELEKRNVNQIKYSSLTEHAPCIFEAIYFSNPRSRENGRYHEDFRQECGAQLGKELPHLSQDIGGLEKVVVPILDSGKQAALGLKENTGIPYNEAFLRIHNPPGTQSRSFTAPSMEERTAAAYKKLHLRPESVAGKCVITVDDSIVRSTTMKIINQRLRDAGASQIINLIASPPIQSICPYGLDFTKREQLGLVQFGSVEGIQEEIRADQLHYLTLQGMRGVASEIYGKHNCDGCFSGKYPVGGGVLDLTVGGRPI